MGKVVITCNGTEPSNLFPPFIIGSSALASGDDLVIFVTPSAAPAFTKGVLDVNKINKEDLRDGLEIAGATTFIKEAEGSTLSLSF
jgi:predicted peroxiredoxin